LSLDRNAARIKVALRGEYPSIKSIVGLFANAIGTSAKCGTCSASRSRPPALAADPVAADVARAPVRKEYSPAQPSSIRIN
jgi:hypothetical protein